MEGGVEISSISLQGGVLTFCIYTYRCMDGILYSVKLMSFGCVVSVHISVTAQRLVREKVANVTLASAEELTKCLNGSSQHSCQTALHQAPKEATEEPACCSFWENGSQSTSVAKLPSMRSTSC